MRKRIAENFDQFMKSSQILQDPGSARRYEYGSNPEGMDLPYNFEVRPETGPNPIDSTQSLLDRMETLSRAALNTIEMRRMREDEISPYINRELKKAYVHLREGYLRLMDSKNKR